MLLEAPADLDLRPMPDSAVDQCCGDVAAGAVRLLSFEMSPKDPLGLRRLTNAAEAVLSDAVGEQ
jgi:hypothetical protein